MTPVIRDGSDRLNDECIAEVARRAIGPTATVTSWSSEPLGHRVENLTTARLDRVSLALDAGQRLTVVAKCLRPASAAPTFATIPPEHHQQVLRDLHWLDEPAVYRSGIGRSLPEPMRIR